MQLFPRLRLVPEHTEIPFMRGRIMGLYAMTFAGMTPFGSLLIGTIAEHFGVQMACALGGGLGLVALVAFGRTARGS